MVGRTAGTDGNSKRQGEGKSLRLGHLQIGQAWRGSYRGISLIRNSAPLRPYSRTISRALWWSYGGGHFLMKEVPL